MTDTLPQVEIGNNDGDYPMDDNYTNDYEPTSPIRSPFPPAGELNTSQNGIPTAPHSLINSPAHSHRSSMPSPALPGASVALQREPQAVLPIDRDHRGSGSDVGTHR